VVTNLTVLLFQVLTMKTSKFFKLLGAALFSIILMAGNVQAASNKQKAPEKVVIAQFGQAKFLLYLPLYIAMEEGLFAKRGMDVSLKFAGNDDQIFAAVLGGSADFGMGDPVFTAISK
jgi:ABC-type nitrate/sulfonate/bicarbonate transport system substrate-binding protein